MSNGKVVQIVTEVLDKTNSLDLIGEDVRTLKEALTKTNEQELTNRIQLTSEQVEKDSEDRFSLWCFIAICS